ncbi:hypothetical protein HNQ78_002989 [Phycisphaera mikurensis]|nr:hypothetical protein [Phycisphaera mikurensis]
MEARGDHGPQRDRGGVDRAVGHAEADAVAVEDGLDLRTGEAGDIGVASHGRGDEAEGDACGRGRSRGRSRGIRRRLAYNRHGPSLVEKVAANAQGDPAGLSVPAKAPAHAPRGDSRRHELRRRNTASTPGRRLRCATPATAAQGLKTGQCHSVLTPSPLTPFPLLRHPRGLHTRSPAAPREAARTTPGECAFPGSAGRYAAGSPGPRHGARSA